MLVGWLCDDSSSTANSPTMTVAQWKQHAGVDWTNRVDGFANDIYAAVGRPDASVQEGGQTFLSWHCSDGIVQVAAKSLLLNLTPPRIFGTVDVLGVAETY